MSVANEGAARERVVLIVDDEEPNRQLLTALLSAQGYTVRIACDGPAALEQVKVGGIDLMLLDVMMPGMDGVEACQRIRKDLGLLDLTIVFVTALSDRESRLRAKLAGADDFLVKPIDSFELTFRVANWMKLSLLRECELRALELEQRLHEAAGETERLARRVGDLAPRLATAEPGDRASLSRELVASAADLHALQQQMRGTLMTGTLGSAAPSSEPRAAELDCRGERSCP